MTPGRVTTGTRRGAYPLITAFSAGTAAILLIRFLHPEPYEAALLAALFAIAAIVALGIYYFMRRESEDVGRAGDDLYYLGLLFTLVSLIYALVELFILDTRISDIADRTYELIGSFGIALLSTVAGILGRIILQSAGEPVGDSATPGFGRRGTGFGSPREGDESALIPSDPDLHMLARHMRAEMRGAADAFSHYNRTTMRQAEDTKRHAERIVNDFTRTLQANATDAIVQTESAYQKLAESVQTMGAGLDRRIEEVSDGLETLVTQLGAASRSLADVPDGLEQAQRSIRSLGETSDAVSSRLDDRTGDVVRATEALIGSAREYQDVTADNVKQARTIRAHMDTDIAEWTERAERMRNAFSATDENTGVLTTLVERVDSINSSLSDLSVEIGQMQRGMGAFRQAAEAITAGLDQGTKEIEGSGRALSRIVQEHQELVERGLGTAAGLGGRLDSEVTEWTRRAERIREALAACDHAAGALAALTERLSPAGRTGPDLAAVIERTQREIGTRQDVPETTVESANKGRI